MKIFQHHRWLCIILVVAFLARLIGITNPVADWHSWRQADTASVTREYVKHGVDLLHPTFHDLSNIPAKLDNPNGYRMVEFPLVNAGVAVLLRAFPTLPFVATHRMVTVLSSLVTLVALYALVKELSGQRAAIGTAVVFALLPYSMYYSRVILPEPFLLTSSTVAIWAFLRWLRSGKLIWWLLATIMLVISFLLKPSMVFLAPVFGMLLILEAGTNWRKWMLAGVMSGIAVAPMLWWRQWITQFPEGIPALDWLFNGEIDGKKIRLQPAWFRWLGYERLTKMFLGWVGMVFLPLGLLRLRKDTLIYLSWWLGILAYFIVIARGNVQHDYYQNLMLPIVAITVGRGMAQLYEWLRQGVQHKTAVVTVGAIAALSWVLAWQQVKGFYNINHWEYLEAGVAVDQLTPPDAKVIAPAFGDTHFLFQTNRTGWPIGFDIETKRSQGASFYVTTSDDDEVRSLREKYPVLHKGKRFIILDLRQPL